MKRMAHILAPTDFSDCSRHALQKAVEFSRQFGARVHVLHVIEANFAGGIDGTYEVVKKQAASAELGRLGSVLADIDAVLEIRVGVVPDEILQKAAELSANLIVMATQCRQGRARLFLGSVTEEVMRRSTCPVLTVNWEEKPVESLREKNDHAHQPLLDDGTDRPVQVRHIMRREVVAVTADTSVKEVMDLMLHYGLSGIPVVDHHYRLMGLVPESRLLGANLHDPRQFLSRQKNVLSKTARSIMVSRDEVPTTHEHASLTEATGLMSESNVDRLFVLRDNVVVGDLTRSDILRTVRRLEHESSSQR